MSKRKTTTLAVVYYTRLNCDGSGNFSHKLTTKVEDASYMDELVATKFFRNYRIKNVKVILVPQDPAGTRASAFNVVRTDDPTGSWAYDSGLSVSAELQNGAKMAAHAKGHTFNLTFNNKEWRELDDSASTPDETDEPQNVEIRAVNSETIAASQYIWYCLIVWTIEVDYRVPR